jgi:hypothetical protein
MDRHDVRVRETGRGARLAQESLAQHGLRRHHRGEQLERHGSFEREIASEQDDTHPAAAKLALDRVPSCDRALEALKVGDGLAHLPVLPRIATIALAVTPTGLLIQIMYFFIDNLPERSNF